MGKIEGKQLSLNLDWGVTREQACIMCHLSSECEDCCLRCNHKNGCAGQLCSQPSRDHEGQRWNTWMYLVRTSLPELKRFIPKKYHKYLKETRQ